MITIALSLIAIIFSIASVVINYKTIKNMENFRKLLNRDPKKLYATIVFKGLFKAKMLCYLAYPFIRLGLIKEDVVINKATSFISFKVK